MKKSVWYMTDLCVVTQKVAFDEPVTQEEAVERWMNEDYEDILDIEVWMNEECEGILDIDIESIKKFKEVK